MLYEKNMLSFIGILFYDENIPLFDLLLFKVPRYTNTSTLRILFYMLFFFISVQNDHLQRSELWYTLRITLVNILLVHSIPFNQSSMAAFIPLSYSFYSYIFCKSFKLTVSTCLMIEHFFFYYDAVLLLILFRFIWLCILAYWFS